MKNQAINDHLKLITENGLLQAMKEIDENDFPKTRRIKYYKAIYNDTDKAYPPPLLIDKAYNYSVNQKLPEDFFNRIGKGSEYFKFLEENGFNIIELENDSMKEKRFYLKRVLNQDIERTFSVNNTAAEEFFDLKLNNGEDQHILIDYINSNELKNTRFNKRNTRNEHRFFPINRDRLNEEDILLFTKSGDDYSMEVIYSNDERFEDLSHLLDGANHLLTDHLTGNHNNSTKTNAMIEQPLNQILYGPPGTGKTYSTITKALDIIGVDYKDYEEAQDLFQDELGSRIEFVTMHQSFSYEDFVQGLKPKTGDNGIEFDYKNGVFKAICQRAEDSMLGDSLGQELSLTNREMLKIAFYLAKFNGKKKGEKQSNEFLGYDSDNDAFIGISTRTGHKPNSIKNHRDKFDFLFHDHTNYTARKGWTPRNDNGVLDNTSKWPYQEIYTELNPVDFDQLSNQVRELLEKSAIVEEEVQGEQKFIIILDEINRANISRVFGELIALIEDDKRDGKLSATLPSGDSFSVPSNLYIIGTMNTADKSIALVDIALRRRFRFVPMYPDTDVLKNVLEGNGFPGQEVRRRTTVLTILNQIIRSKKTVDYEIGHSYFMSDDKLEDIMNEQVLPLLNEYFMYDLRAVKSLLENKQKDRDKNDIPMLGVKFDSQEYKNRGLLKIKTIDPSNVVVQANDASDSEEEEEQ